MTGSSNVTPLRRPTHGGNLAWAARLAGCEPGDILDFSASINPLGPPRSILAALHQGVDALRQYPDPECRTLRQALGEAHDLPPEWLLPGNGAAELLTWAGRDLAAMQTVYLPVPAFADYERALRTFGARVERLPLQARGCHWALSIAEGVPFHRCGIVLTNPHNPTGALLSAGQLDPYLEQFGLVVLDEAFMDFLPPGSCQSALARVRKSPNLVVLRSLTKFYSIPGLRLGYAAAHPERLRRWQRWRDPWAVNGLAQAAGVAALADRAFAEATWEWLASARSRLLSGLQTVPGLHPLPSAANFLLVRADVRVDRLQRRLLERDRILVRDCLSFPELGNAFFRVAVRRESENERLLAALAAAVPNLPRAPSQTPF